MVHLSAPQEFAIDFRLDEVPATVGFPISDAVAPAILRIEPDEFRTRLAQDQAELARAAAELAAEPAYYAYLAQIPVGSRILALGDSITAFRQSFAELLSVQLTGRAQVFNGGISGATTAGGVQVTQTRFFGKRPTHSVIMFGTNDMTRFGSPTSENLLSIGEYERNIGILVKRYEAVGKVVLMLHPPVHEDLANAAYSGLGYHYLNADRDAYAAAARRAAHSAPVLDLAPLLDSADLYHAEGVHPTLAGHVRAARALLPLLA